MLLQKTCYCHECPDVPIECPVVPLLTTGSKDQNTELTK